MLAIAVVFALALGGALLESIVWYRSQIAGLISSTKGDWQAGAVLLALFSSYAKKQIALVLASVLALLGLGLSLHAMKESSQAEIAGGAGFKLSFATFSPGICAFLTAGLIVLAVVWKDDKFESASPTGDTSSPTPPAPTP
ncbi:hypothetical protein RCH10_005232 [Variovorax sp. GrIS 2.14]|uniref:hypothetical protein n=1 Tax=Variovorax sp. GrIS 2.14 TaxID=3071709 RepID=UPI0038F62B1B